MESDLTSTVPTYFERVRLPPTKRLSETRVRDTIVDTVLRKNNSIQIKIADQKSKIVKTYSTGDEIKGIVELKFEKDTPFEEIVITFEGQSAIFVEKVPASGPSIARKTARLSFLKLQQPIPLEILPENNICEAGQLYAIPFIFRVPSSLLPDTCFHKVEDENVRSYHLKLPPSMGGSSISSDGHTLMDDMAPNMARINYGICARVTSGLASGSTFTIAERIEKVLVFPRYEEAAPVTIGKHSYHAMCCEKKVRKGILRIAKAGSIAAEITQPQSLQLSSPSEHNSEPVTTTATVNLRFLPVSRDEQPPQLGKIVTKLRVFTFFGVAPFQTIPEFNRRLGESPYHGVYSEGFKLNTRNISNVSWTCHDPDAILHQYPGDPTKEAAISTDTALPESPTKWNPGLPFYTASILVPISLAVPATNGKPKQFLPTFHSCLLSRTYTVKLTISYNSSNSSISTSHIVLKSPIQISLPGQKSTADATTTESYDRIEADLGQLEGGDGAYEHADVDKRDFGY